MNKKLIMSSVLLCLTGAVLIFTLVFALTSLDKSVAWYSHNRSVRAGGISVSVNVDGGEDVQLKSHPISEISEATQEYTALTSVEEYALPLNDPNGISYSAYKRALAILITFTCNLPADIEVRLLSSTADVTVAADNFLSNCIEIAPAAWNAETGIATVSGTFQSPVTVTGDTCTKETSLLLESLSIPQGTTTLCYIIKYNESFLTYASNQVLANGGTYFQLDYKNDIAFSIQ